MSPRRSAPPSAGGREPLARPPFAHRGFRPRTLVLVGFAAAAALARLLPHPPDFTPVGALALFCGATFASRRAALWVPLGAMLAGDVGLELTGRTGLHAGLPLVYALFAASALLGRGLLAERRGPERVAAASIASATLFFLVSNLGTWTWSGSYAHDLAGLGACYAAALPFWANDVAGHLVYGAALFGALALLERRFPALAAPSPLALAEAARSPSP